MSTVTEEAVRLALRVVQDPDLHRDIESLGFVKLVTIEGGRVAVRIELTTPACPVKDLLRDQAAAAIAAVPGVEHVDVEMTAAVRTSQPATPLIPGVRHVIAVASGKGGVGKSTVSCNLAIALSQTGAKVGILDADVYGPSVTLMMGAEGQPEMVGEKINPMYRHGVKIMSMGFFLEQGKAVVWRGPMIGKFINQMLGDVLWGELDYLVVDLPPGTGDASMSLAQLIPLTGVVVVMTPQDVARLIAYKSVDMFKQLAAAGNRNVEILGVIENMSGYSCPHCGEVIDIFGSGGGERAALSFGVPFLGAIPIDPNISAGGDAGRPSVLIAPESPQAIAFKRIAGQLAARVSTLTYTET